MVLHKFNAAMGYNKYISNKIKMLEILLFPADKNIFMYLKK